MSINTGSQTQEFLMFLGMEKQLEKLYLYLRNIQKTERQYKQKVQYLSYKNNLLESSLFNMCHEVKETIIQNNTEQIQSIKNLNQQIEREQKQLKLIENIAINKIIDKQVHKKIQDKEINKENKNNQIKKINLKEYQNNEEEEINKNNAILTTDNSKVTELLLEPLKQIKNIKNNNIISYEKQQYINNSRKLENNYDFFNLLFQEKELQKKIIINEIESQLRYNNFMDKFQSNQRKHKYQKIESSI